MGNETSSGGVLSGTSGSFIPWLSLSLIGESAGMTLVAPTGAEAHPAFHLGEAIIDVLWSFRLKQNRARFLRLFVCHGCKGT
jgi:hypothetical protein